MILVTILVPKLVAQKVIPPTLGAHFLQDVSNMAPGAPQEAQRGLQKAPRRSQEARPGEAPRGAAEAPQRLPTSFGQVFRPRGAPERLRRNEEAPPIPRQAFLRPHVPDKAFRNMGEGPLAADKRRPTPARRRSKTAPIGLLPPHVPDQVLRSMGDRSCASLWNWPHSHSPSLPTDSQQSDSSLPFPWKQGG